MLTYIQPCMLSCSSFGSCSLMLSNTNIWFAVPPVRNSSPAASATWHVPPSSQDPLFPVGLPTHFPSFPIAPQIQLQVTSVCLCKLCLHTHLLKIAVVNNTEWLQCHIPKPILQSACKAIAMWHWYQWHAKPAHNDCIHIWSDILYNACRVSYTRLYKLMTVYGH